MSETIEDRAIRREEAWKREQRDATRKAYGEPTPATGGFTPTFSRVELLGLRDARTDPVEYIVDRYIPRGHVSLLSGHGGSGKTNQALIWAAHVAAGRDWNECHVTQGRVLIVSLEDSAARIKFVLRWIVEAFDLPWSAVETNIIVMDGSANDAALATEYRDPAHGTVLLETNAFGEMAMAAAAENCDLIVVDNASDGFAGNENDRQQVRKFVKAMLGRIARENDCGLLLLAHIDKHAARNGSRGNTFSGSTAWHNSARSRSALVESEIGSPTLMHEKLNLGKKADPVTLAWNDYGVLIPQAKARFNPEPEEPADTLSKDASDVLRAIEAVHASGDIVPNTRGGNATTLHYLRNYPELPADLKAEGRGAKDAKSRFWSAITFLDRAGLIVSEEYKDAYRNDRKRWLPASVRQCASVGTNAATNAVTHSRVSGGALLTGGTGGTNATNALTQTPADDYRKARDGE